MKITMLKSKIHRAVVTGADLNYEGSIAIDPKLCDLANLHKFERVEIYNCDNGARFATYVIHGKPGEICLNGAAARLAHYGDKVIICSYGEFENEEAINYEPKLIFVDEDNEPKSLDN